MLLGSSVLLIGALLFLRQEWPLILVLIVGWIWLGTIEIYLGDKGISSRSSAKSVFRRRFAVFSLLILSPLLLFLFRQMLVR